MKLIHFFVICYLIKYELKPGFTGEEYQVIWLIL